MLGVKDVKCTVEHIYKHFETTRRQSDDDLSIAPGSPRSVSTFATAVDELPSGPAALPRDAECFRLLFCPSSFRGLTDSFLDSWIGDAAVAKVEFEAMYQRTTLDHTFMGGMFLNRDRGLTIWSKVDSRHSFDPMLFAEPT